MVNRNLGLLKLPIQASHVLEIRLSMQMWKRVVKIAEYKRKSYSWVVRYCVFRLIKRSEPARYIAGSVVWPGKRRLRQSFCDLMDQRAFMHKSADAIHRHRLCLYGNDELLIRMTAGMLNVTMTHLVRLALEWYLGSVEKRINNGGSRFHELAFYWLGIKCFAVVEFPNRHTDYADIRLMRVPEYAYW